MFLFLLLMIGVNLLIGFCAAVRVRQLIEMQPDILVVESAEAFLDDLDEKPPTDQPKAASKAKTPEPAPEEAIPYEYVAVLEAECVVANSLVEASAQVLRLEVGRYRAKLVAIENKLRETWYQPTEDALTEIAEELDAVNIDWLDKQAEAAQHLDGSQEGLGAYSDIGRRLCDTLFEQTAQIETTLSNLQQLDFQDNLNDVCRKLVLEIARLIDLCHDLRDKMTETIVTVLRAEKRLGTVDKGMKLDGLTGLKNRTGFECQMFEWWRDDIRRERSLSIAAIDIDTFRKLNERLGTEVGDQIIASLGKYLSELMRSSRGFEYAMRLEGQRFLLFFGDIGPRGATSAVERIRQTVDGTFFEYDGEELELKISAGVTEMKPDDTIPKLLGRSITALRTAKKNGRNRTFIDEGQGPMPIDPPTYQIREKVVTVGG
ncbi:sensor domain-containing diguanylate cyclase [Bremerella sp. T1]|uniref:sensor domain-containing diguanylate cyclase n=1 Tax=Bremerella sp. TYQ1 TaxID=3119568 RepID=UPI001CCB22D2|nr:GGDEF domain-containing protein [Bremerella volcania]UBM38222.1 GGDEF domain-containing protein [Bremerella volcania]